MKNQITIREAITEAEAAVFWEQLHIYFLRDIFPDPKDEDREYFLGDEYRDAICKVHDRPGDSPGVRKTVKGAVKKDPQQGSQCLKALATKN